MVATRSLFSPRPGRPGRWLAVCVLLVPLAGCSSGIGVRRANTSPLLAAWRASFFEADELSPRTTPHPISRTWPNAGLAPVA